jgi:hypothetical protein
MLIDLDHHIIRGILYSAHGFDTEVWLRQELGRLVIASSFVSVSPIQCISHACDYKRTLDASLKRLKLLILGIYTQPHS